MKYMKFQAEVEDHDNAKKDQVYDLARRAKERSNFFFDTDYKGKKKRGKMLKAFPCESWLK